MKSLTIQEDNKNQIKDDLVLILFSNKNLHENNNEELGFEVIESLKLAYGSIKSDAGRIFDKYYDNL